MKKKAYQQYIAETENWLHRGRRRLLENCMERAVAQVGKTTASRRILEIGAGSGRNIEVLAKFGSVDVIEVDQLGIEPLSKNLSVNRLFTQEVPFALDSKYDIICAMDFVEHVENDDAVFDWMADKLDDNGVLFLTVPAYQFLFSSHDVALNHHRRYTLGQLLRLNKGKMTVLKKGYFNFSLFPLIAISRTLERLTAKKTTREEKQSSSVNPMLDKLFFLILQAETALIRRFSLFPYGLTAFVILTRKS